MIKKYTNVETAKLVNGEGKEILYYQQGDGIEIVDDSDSKKALVNGQGEKNI